jgi:hypothetical protein
MRGTSIVGVLQRVLQCKSTKAAYLQLHTKMRSAPRPTSSSYDNLDGTSTHSSDAAS